MVNKKLDLMHHGDRNNTFEAITDMKSASDYFHFTCTNIGLFLIVMVFLYMYLCDITESDIFLRILN